MRAWPGCAEALAPSQRTDSAAPAADAAESAAAAAAAAAPACMGAVEASSLSAARPFTGWKRKPLLAPAARTERRVRPPCSGLSIKFLAPENHSTQFLVA